MLIFSGEKFDEVKIDYDEWPNWKPTLPFKQIPLLEITSPSDGKTTVIAQSNAIERYLANRFNLFGKDDLERARIDMINEHIVDLINLLVDCYRAFAFNRADKELKKVELAKILDETAPRMLKEIEVLFEVNQREMRNVGYLVGDTLSYADIKLVCSYGWFKDKKDEILDKVPLLKEHLKTVMNHQKLREQFGENENMEFAHIFEMKSDEDFVTRIKNEYGPIY
jgi:glutathione S-transferase